MSFFLDNNDENGENDGGYSEYMRMLADSQTSSASRVIPMDGNSSTRSDVASSADFIQKSDSGYVNIQNSDIENALKETRVVDDSGVWICVIDMHACSLVCNCRLIVSPQ